MDFTQAYDFLMRELRLMHSPTGIFFLFGEEDTRAFRRAYPWHSPVRPVTFCQAELGARMQGIPILLEMDRLWCEGARYVFGLRALRERDIEDHLKFCECAAQARSFMESKPRLGTELHAVGLLPLGQCLRVPDVVHFCCDNMQAYHILDDWMAAVDRHPLRPVLCINSAICGGSVFSFNENSANLTLACAGSYNSGKMERGEINIFLPGKQLEPVLDRMRRRREQSGGISLTRLGQPFPGADICQNCPLIIFRQGSSETASERSKSA